MVRAITIGREYGSGGSLIAKAISDRLGWRLIDDPTIAEIARSARATPEVVRAREECVDPWFHQILKALWRGGYEGAVSGPRDEAWDSDAIATLWNRVIVEAAGIGQCVTVGRGGQCLLQRRTDAFHVYVYAPMRDKVARLKDREPSGTDLAAAARDRDGRRAEYMRHYFNAEWKNPHLYHLMLCSSIGIERAADVVLCAAGLP
jgi:cytidylate kinase